MLITMPNPMQVATWLSTLIRSSLLMAGALASLVASDGDTRFPAHA